MTLAEAILTARFLGPETIERGRTQAMTCPLYRSGALVAPTQAGSSVSIYNARGDAVVSAAAVTVAGSIATYSLLASVTTGLTLEKGWVVEWSLIVSGVTYTFRNSAALVRRLLYPVITDEDLYSVVSSLRPVAVGGSAPITKLATFQTYLDAAWAILNRRLLAAGDRPNLIMSPSDLYDVHLWLTLAMIFDDLSTRLNEAYKQKADDYRSLYEDAWRDLSFEYDPAEEGIASSSRQSAQPSVWLSSRRNS